MAAETSSTRGYEIMYLCLALGRTTAQKSNPYRSIWIGSAEIGLYYIASVAKNTFQFSLDAFYFSAQRHLLRNSRYFFPKISCHISFFPFFLTLFQLTKSAPNYSHRSFQWQGFLPGDIFICLDSRFIFVDFFGYKEKKHYQHCKPYQFT